MIDRQRRYPGTGRRLAPGVRLPGSMVVGSDPFAWDGPHPSFALPTCRGLASALHASMAFCAAAPAAPAARARASEHQLLAGTSSLLRRKSKAARALWSHSRRILRRSRAHRPDQHIRSASGAGCPSNSRLTTKGLTWERRKVRSTSTHPSGRQATRKPRWAPSPTPTGREEEEAKAAGKGT